MNLNNTFFDVNSMHQKIQEYVLSSNFSAARDTLEIITSIQPNDERVLQWEIIIALAFNQIQDVIDLAQKALIIVPKESLEVRTNIYFNLGQAYSIVGNFSLALNAFEQVLSVYADHKEALFCSAKAYSSLSQHGKAGRLLTRVLSIEPENLEALGLFANTLVKGGFYKLALEYFIKHEKLKPASPFIACMIVFLYRQLANWDYPSLPVNKQEIQMLQKNINSNVRPELALLEFRTWQNMPALEPFASLVLYDDPALHYHASKQFLQHIHPQLEMSLKNSFPNNRPLRVAYVSCEFNEHATSYLLAGILARHNIERVKVYLLSFAPSKEDNLDEMQKRIKNMGHTWVDIHQWSDKQVSKWCREQGIDIAVDLKGLTRDSRIDIFANRISPVQVSWLGYPGTMPASYYDWILADNVVLPEKLEKHFSERIWRLPHCYQPNDCDRKIDLTPQYRKDHNLPEESFVLVCFNNTFKITPVVWKIWMRLLFEYKNTVLWLLDSCDDTRNNLCMQAMNEGIDPKRLIFAPILSQSKHLARLSLGDLSLDTLPYNAHTTASDALWAGVPHITCMGESFASRVGASLLTALDVPELITYSLDEYEMLIRRFLNEPEQLIKLRKKITQNRVTAPLFDSNRFVHDLEDALYGMVLAE